MLRRHFALCEMVAGVVALAWLVALPFSIDAKKGNEKNPDVTAEAPANKNQMWTVTLMDSQNNPLGSIRIKSKDVRATKNGHGVSIDMDGGTAVWEPVENK